MKNITIILFFISLLVPRTLAAQIINNQKNHYEIGFTVMDANKNFNGIGMSVNLNYSHRVYQNLFIGVGLEFISLKENSDGGRNSRSTTGFAIYPLLEYMIPISHTMDFTSVLTGGVNFQISTPKFTKYDPLGGYFSPQTGFKIKLCPALSLDFRAVYKYISNYQLNAWGALIGISF